MNERYIELIDKYFHQKLSTIEQEEFDSYLKNDPTFQDEINLFKELNESIIKVENDNILKIIEKQHQRFEKRQFRTKWGSMILMAIILLLLGIIGWIIWNKREKQKIEAIKITKNIISDTIKSNTIKDEISVYNEETEDIKIEKKKPTVEQVKMDTLWYNDFQKELILGEKIITHQYIFTNKKLTIYGLEKIDLQQSSVKIIQNKFYFIDPIHKIGFEIKPSRKKTTIVLLEDKKISQLSIEKAFSKKNTIEIEQKIISEKKVKTNFSIFTISLLDKSMGYQFIPKKNLLIWTENISLKFGKDFDIIFIPENKTYYLRKNQKYFHLFIVEKLSDIKEVTNLELMEYLTSRKMNLLIKTYQIENELLQYDY